MEAAGLIERSPYQQRPLRHAYRLTDMGRALHPMLRDMCRYVPGTWTPPEAFMRE
jgi:DNA-binding HxlR family transcriptional regulator